MSLDPIWSDSQSMTQINVQGSDSLTAIYYTMYLSLIYLDTFMSITTTYIYCLSLMPYTMASSINYRYTLFEWANLTPISGKPNFKTLHKLWNKIKANGKSVYYNLGEGAHVNIGLVLTESEYTLISNTPLIYLSRPGPLIITAGTTALINYTMRITHTKAVPLFFEVTGIEQAPIQHIITTVDKTYIYYICNQTTNLINYAVADVITHIQDIYVQPMSHELLKYQETVKNAICCPHEPIASIFSAVEELLEFADITGFSYTQN